MFKAEIIKELEKKFESNSTFYKTLQPILYFSNDKYYNKDNLTESKNQGFLKEIKKK